MNLPGDEGPALTLYSADPGTPAADALKLLTSWAPSSRTQPTRSPGPSVDPRRVRAGPGRSGPVPLSGGGVTAAAARGRNLLSCVSRCAPARVRDGGGPWRYYSRA